MNVAPSVVGATAGSGVSGALTIILFWALSTFAKVDVPPPVVASTTVLLQAAGTFIGGYISHKPST